MKGQEACQLWYQDLRILPFYLFSLHFKKAILCQVKRKEFAILHHSGLSYFVNSSLMGHILDTFAIEHIFEQKIHCVFDDVEQTLITKELHALKKKECSKNVILDVSLIQNLRVLQACKMITKKRVKQIYCIVFIQQ